MIHPTPDDQHRDGAAVEDVPVPPLEAIQVRYEAAKASIVAADPLPETEAIDLRTLPPVPADAPAGGAVPPTLFHGNVVAELPRRRRWWRHLR